MTRRPRTRVSLTPVSGGRMLLSMLRRHTVVRLMVVLIAACTVIIAGPIHAAHHHDDGRLHAPCAVCQLHSPACEPLLKTFAGASLEPLFTLAVSIANAPRTAQTTVTPARAPPVFLA
jgi:hypothetical protein